jgi:hypothetical protein
MHPVRQAKRTAGKRPTETVTTSKDAIVALALALGLSSKVAAIIVAAFAALPFLVSYVVDLRKKARG